MMWAWECGGLEANRLLSPVHRHWWVETAGRAGFKKVLRMKDSQDQLAVWAGNLGMGRWGWGAEMILPRACHPWHMLCWKTLTCVSPFDPRQILIEGWREGTCCYLLISLLWTVSCSLWLTWSWCQQIPHTCSMGPVTCQRWAASPAGEAVGPAAVGGPGQGERQLQRSTGPRKSQVCSAFQMGSSDHCPEMPYFCWVRLCSPVMSGCGGCPGKARRRSESQRLWLLI